MNATPFVKKLKRIVYTAVAAILALCSLPNLPTRPVRHLHSVEHSAKHRAFPTRAEAATLPHQAFRDAVTEAPKTMPPAKVPPPATPNPSAPPATPQPGTLSPDGFTSPVNPDPLYQLGKLRVRVIDGRTMQPLSGAEVVLIETEQRRTTDATGYTGWFDAPIIRNPRYRPMIAELHGQLGVIVYKNGYRDSVHLGIRMHGPIQSQTTVWMYKIGPGDRRIEPVFYEEPYHHLWLIDLADRFRSKTQPGEGPQRP